MSLRDIWIPIIGIPYLPLLYLCTRVEIKRAMEMGLPELERFWREEWRDLVKFILWGWLK